MALLNFIRREKPQQDPTTLNAFLEGFSIEVMPRTAAKVEDFSALLP
ncbi:MAG: methylenetetrahydrofolate reductase (NADPH), partial [Paracoccaceae bacterium]